MEKKEVFELINEGSLDCEFKGNGNPTGDIGEIVLTNKSDKDYEVAVPKGTLFVPADKKCQTMTTGTGLVVPLRGGETRAERIDDGFCNDDYTKPPPSPTGGGRTTVSPAPSEGVRDIVNKVERNLESGRYNATRLMRRNKARQTLIQWILWRTANPKTFDKETAFRILTGQYEKREKRPKDEDIERGIDMLFDDIDLTVKGAPSAAPVPPAAVPGPRRPCECHGDNAPTHEGSPPDVKISEHYRNESDRREISDTIRGDITSTSAQVTPGTVCAFSKEGAAVGGYGDARANYLFYNRLGAIMPTCTLMRTEQLNATARGQNADTITVYHRDEEGCEYEKVVGAAAIVIIGSGAVVYDPLQDTEDGYRVLEKLYDLASDKIKQEWITKVLDAIKEATTKYHVDVRADTSIDVSVGRNAGSARTKVFALLDRDGSELKSSREDLANSENAFAMASDCTKGDSLSLRFDGETELQVEADDGGHGIVGQESLIGYVWYWACRTIRDGEEIGTDAKWGHDYRFTAVSFKDMADANISLRESNTKHFIGDILNSTVGEAAKKDPFDCAEIRTALEDAIKRWIIMLSDQLGAYKSVGEKLK